MTMHYIPPVGAIIALDFFLHKAAYSDGSKVERKFNFGAIIGVVAGALAGNFVHFGIAAINAMVVACVCYIVAEIIGRKKV